MRGIMNASTLRRTLTLFTALAAVSCGGGETRAGARRTTLPPGPALYLGFDFSKDGRIAYGKFIDGKAAIYVANGDGTNAHRVSFGVWDSGPLWSPDGKWIVFGRDAGGQGDVVIIPADSGAERIVAGTPASEGPNAWLSDGSGVVLSSVDGKFDMIRSS